MLENGTTKLPARIEVPVEQLRELVRNLTVPAHADVGLLRRIPLYIDVRMRRRPCLRLACRLAPLLVLGGEPVEDRLDVLARAEAVEREVGALAVICSLLRRPNLNPPRTRRRAI